MCCITACKTRFNHERVEKDDRFQLLLLSDNHQLDQMNLLSEIRATRRVLRSSRIRFHRDFPGFAPWLCMFPRLRQARVKKPCAFRPGNYFSFSPGGSPCDPDTVSFSLWFTRDSFPRYVRAPLQEWIEKVCMNNHALFNLHWQSQCGCCQCLH